MRQILNISGKDLELNTLFIQPTRWCGLNCRGCCPAGTLISTPSGQVPIEQIQVGDKVYAYNNSSEQLEEALVGNTYHRHSDEVFEIQIGSEVLVVTGEHPVMTRRGWVEAKDLTEDDEVLCDADHKG